MIAARKRISVIVRPEGKARRLVKPTFLYLRAPFETLEGGDFSRVDGTTTSLHTPQNLARSASYFQLSIHLFIQL